MGAADKVKSEGVSHWLAHAVRRAPASPVAGTYLNDFAQHEESYFSRRSGTFILVVSLHAVLFYGLVTTLSHLHTKANPGDLQNQPVVDPRPREPLPALPPPQLNSYKFDAPIPEVSLPGETDTSRELTTTTDQPPTQPPPSTILSHAPTQVTGGPGAGFPDPDDFYPSQARRLEEQGSATVRVCVDTKGRLTSDPVVQQSSGNGRLDEGALKLASAGSGHYRASTEDGQPVNSCYPFRIRFQIKY